MITKIFQFGLDLLFPDRCAGCQKWHTVLCPDCADRLPRAEGADLPENTLACLSYNHPTTKRLVYLLKNRGSQAVAEVAARLMLPWLSELSPAGQPIYLIPTPATSAKIRRRGYNQALILSEALRRMNTDRQRPIEIKTDWVKKTRSTKDQTETKNRYERSRNLNNAFITTSRFQPNPDAVLIVIDDVITTGSTFREISRTLKKAGGRSIAGLAFCH